MKARAWNKDGWNMVKLIWTIFGIERLHLFDPFWVGHLQRASYIIQTGRQWLHVRCPLSPLPERLPGGPKTLKYISWAKAEPEALLSMPKFESELLTGFPEFGNFQYYIIICQLCPVACGSPHFSAENTDERGALLDSARKMWRRCRHEIRF